MRGLFRDQIQGAPQRSLVVFAPSVFGRAEAVWDLIWWKLELVPWMTSCQAEQGFGHEARKAG
jgi:hypothetical protein